MNTEIKKIKNEQEIKHSLFFKDLEENIIMDYVQNNFPAVNITETKTEYIVEISAPGFSKEDIKIEVNKDMMTITARIEETEKEDDQVLRKEFCSASFSRSFILPEDVDTERVKAKEKHGLIIITFPKSYDPIEYTNRAIKIE
jgi:Molecular chaperone (small heat shock protein)